ncbi:glycosyltransferase [Nocardioides sp.]|uniref:glycosyltransferase n=1 Tax=Nocardioides sp. TaxID=35761 RepID=UPI0039E2ABB9
MIAPIGDGRRIGEILLDAGLVTPPQLDQALARQAAEGGPLGRHLILGGVVDRRALYQALAEQWGAPLVDLVAEPPTAQELLEIGDPRRYADLGWLPWRYHDGVLTIATSVAPTERVLATARALPGVREVSVRTTTDWDVFRTVQELGRSRLLYGIAELMADTRPDLSARISMATWQKVVPLLALLALVPAVWRWPSQTVVAAFCVANALFLGNIVFKVYFGLRAPLRNGEKERWRRAVRAERARRGHPEEWPGRVPDQLLPTYTILVPVFDEVAVVQKVIANMDRLDYPKSKLDVMILLEEKDAKTIEAAKASRPPEYVRIVVVPEGQPQTKPRACNYGLEFAKGEYVVIYDAEDRPEPDQLREALAAFEMNRLIRRRLDPTTPLLACVQASLMYFNSEYNLLTRMFSIEYAHWFDAMLPGMDDSGLPLPLGGTSNHFRTDILRRLGGWDPYNVTEDADLGLRIASQGYAVGTIASATGEEACSETFAWIRQRTRWIKGYMVTAAVNTRHPIRWLRLNGVGGVISMGGLVLGTPLAFMSYPLALLFTAATYVGVRTGAVGFPPAILQGGVLMLLLGNSVMILASGIAAWRRYNWRVAAYAVFNPIYWLLHSLAAWRAVYQLLFDPHRWEKTPHGLSEDFEDPAMRHLSGAHSF